LLSGLWFFLYASLRAPRVPTGGIFSGPRAAWGGGGPVREKNFFPGGAGGGPPCFAGTGALGPPPPPHRKPHGPPEDFSRGPCNPFFCRRPGETFCFRFFYRKKKQKKKKKQGGGGRGGGPLGGGQKTDRGGGRPGSPFGGGNFAEFFFSGENLRQTRAAPAVFPLFSKRHFLPRGLFPPRGGGKGPDAVGGGRAQGAFGVFCCGCCGGGGGRKRRGAHSFAFEFRRGGPGGAGQATALSVFFSRPAAGGGGGGPGACPGRPLGGGLINPGGGGGGDRPGEILVGFCSKKKASGPLDTGVGETGPAGALLTGPFCGNGEGGPGPQRGPKAGGDFFGGQPTGLSGGGPADLGEGLLPRGRGANV